MVVGIKRKDALDRARRITMADISGDLPTITPTDAELKESGVYHRAKLELMRNPSTSARLHMRKYLDEMAGEMGLVVYAKRYVKKLERARKRLETYEAQKVSIRKVKPIRAVPVKHIHIGKKRRQSIKKLERDIMGKPKRKRKRLHTSRTSKTPRVLRKAIKNGHRFFSYSDDIWKVKSPRRKRRK